MNKNVYINNRKRLIDSLEDNSVVILFSGKAPKKTGDEFYKFSPNRNFYYLTGIMEQNHMVVLSKINSVVSQNLFLKDIDLDKEAWNGKTLRDFEAKEISGIDNVSYMVEFENYLNRLIRGMENVSIMLDLDKDTIEEDDSLSVRFAREITRKYPYVNIKNISSKIIPLRMIKSKEEIDELRKAIEITIKGVESLMKNSKVGMKEYELESYFDFECKKAGAKDLAFITIAAAGKNATTLHYVSNDSTLKDNELILFDLGAAWNLYNADITRTFPINGKFTARQKEVYEAVLRVNKDVINKIKPGLRYKDLNDYASDLIADECMKLGMIDKKEDFRKYYWHSIGHNLGLDTHDVEPQGRDFIFEEGMVFTVEPGIYNSEEEIGIRIEDDVLVTKDGCEVLTKGMIKEVSDIENFMK